MKRTRTSLEVVLAAALASHLLPFQALAAVVFETIQDPAFI